MFLGNCYICHLSLKIKYTSSRHFKLVLTARTKLFETIYVYNNNPLLIFVCLPSKNIAKYTLYTIQPNQLTWTNVRCEADSLL